MMGALGSATHFLAGQRRLGSMRHSEEQTGVSNIAAAAAPVSSGYISPSYLSKRTLQLPTYLEIAPHERPALLRLPQGRQHRSNNPDRLAVAGSRERRTLTTVCRPPMRLFSHQDAGFSFLPNVSTPRQLGPNNGPIAVTHPVTVAMHCARRR